METKFICAKNHDCLTCGDNDKCPEGKKKVNQSAKKKKESSTGHPFENPEKLAEFSKIWREMTKGMTRVERRDFAKWHDEMVE